MANNPIDPELKERAIMHLLPSYNWSLRQVADDIGAGISTVHGRHQQLEMEGLIAQKQGLTGGRSPEQIFSILLEGDADADVFLDYFIVRCRVDDGTFPG